MRRTLSLGVLAVSGLFFFGSSGIAHAQDRNACGRLERDRQDLNKAVGRYGPNSSQARHERLELERDSGRCGYSGADGTAGGI